MRKEKEKMNDEENDNKKMMNVPQDADENHPHPQAVTPAEAVGEAGRPVEAVEDSEAAGTSEAAAQEAVGKLKAQIRYAVQNGQGDNFRREIYSLARFGQLRVADIVLLRWVRKEELNATR